MVTIEEALSKIYELRQNLSIETVALEQSLGRVCANDYFAKFDMPRFDNSAMDGYAVKLGDAAKEVEVVDTVYAGNIAQGSLQKSQAIKIMTGAKLPQGCEAVVAVEDVAQNGKYLKLPHEIKPQANMRFMGEDIKSDTLVIEKNRKITPYDIGVLASQGYSYIQVFKKIEVAVLSSGQELKPHYENLEDGQLHNSNAPTIEALSSSLDSKVYSLQVADDSLQGMVESLQNCLHCDLIVTTGGASVGDKDFTKEAIMKLDAKVIFETVAIKPGKPTSLYKIENRYLLVLPGNPLAAMVNFELFGKAILWCLQNRLKRYHQPISAKIGVDFSKKGNRDSIVLGEYDGEFFQPLALQLPGMVKPLSQANSYMVVAKERKDFKVGDEVKVLLLDSGISSKEKKDFFTR